MCREERERIMDKRLSQDVVSNDDDSDEYDSEEENYNEKSSTVWQTLQSDQEGINLSFLRTNILPHLFVVDNILIQFSFT